MTRSGTGRILRARAAWSELRPRYPDLESRRRRGALDRLPAAAHRRATLGRGDDVLPGPPVVLADRAGVPLGDGRHLRPGHRAGPDDRGGRRPGRRRSSSSPTPVGRAVAAASTTSRRCARSPGWRCRGSRTGARSRSTRTASCARSPSPTSTPRRSRSPRSCSAASRPTPTSDTGAYAGAAAPGAASSRPTITDEMLDAADRGPGAAAADARAQPPQRDRGARSRSRTGCSASSTWVAGDEGRRFDADDLAFGEDFALRAASGHRHRPAAQRAERRRRSGCSGRSCPAELPGCPAGRPRRATSRPATARPAATSTT